MEDRVGDRPALPQGDEPDRPGLDRRLDLQRDLAPGRHPVQLVGPARDRLGIIAEQERRLLRPRQHAVLARADDHHAPRARQRRPQPVGRLVDHERLELSRRGRRLDPELRGRDLVDELRVARLGLLAEVDLGPASPLGHRVDPDEQEVCAGVPSAQQASGHDQGPPQTPELPAHHSVLLGRGWEPRSRASRGSDLPISCCSIVGHRGKGGAGQAAAASGPAGCTAGTRMW